MTLSRRLAAEAVGTAFLLAVVVGSGIMGERLSGGNMALALLANSIATGCGLWVLITLFGPISGAHFNPAVTVAFATTGDFSWRDVLPYVLTQVVFAYVGVAAAHLMFGLPLSPRRNTCGTGPANGGVRSLPPRGCFSRFCSDCACGQRGSVAWSRSISPAPIGSPRRHRSPTPQSRSLGRLRIHLPASDRPTFPVSYSPS